MQDQELFQWIAGGIAPWTVGEIKVESAEQRLEVNVECGDTVPKKCPHCDFAVLVCNQGEEQTWRQPDAGSWLIILKGRPPLITCPDHGVVTVSPPWADWYVRSPDKSLEGPWSIQQLKLLLESGRISPSTLLRRSSSTRWVIAGTVAALFVKQEEAHEPPLSVDELAAVDWAISHPPLDSSSVEPASDSIAPAKNSFSGDSILPARSQGRPSHPNGNRGADSHTNPRDRAITQPRVTPVTPAAATPVVGPPEINLDSILFDDSEREVVRSTSSRPKLSQPGMPREQEKRTAKREEPNPENWNKVLEKAVEMEQKAKGVREKPAIDAASQPVKRSTRREALVRRRGFQDAYQYLTIAFAINACLVCCAIPAICTIFFSRLLLLSASVFIPFEGGNSLQGGQLVECGLSALSLLVLIGFPIWHLIANDGVLWHYVPSALVGMIVGFGLSPDYLDEACAALQWCEFVFGIAITGLTVYTLFAVPRSSRMSFPLIGAILLTAISVVSLFGVRTGSMLTVKADVVPPSLLCAIPDAPLFIFGLFGILISIPGAILVELHGHTASSTRQLIVQTGVLMGVYLLTGLATLGTFVHSAGTGFFDVPLALLPLGCINALAAAIPPTLLLIDPQFSVSEG